MPEGGFNDLVRMTHNKANVLFSRNTRLMQRIADAVGPRPLCFWVDRQGGRTGYVHPLMTAFEDARLEALEEAPERSSYRLTRPMAPWLVHFVMKGESHHLPIALASIYSKYLRELFMICFNRYWRARMPELKPTAGYTQDGRRFLADIGPLLAAGQVDQGRLVRVC